MKRVINTIAIALVAVFISLQTQAQVYTVDTQKSVLTWYGEKVSGDHWGLINVQSGEFTIKDGKLVSGKFEIDMNSIVDKDLTDETWNAKLVGHLKSPDFFDVEKFPKATFEITKAVTFSGGVGTVKGNLTIKGKTNPVEFKATMHKTSEDLKFYGLVIIDRSKYDIKYGSGSFFENLGDKTIYDEFKVRLNIVSTEKK